MFEKFKIDNIFQSREIAGVECVFLPDGKKYFNVFVLKKKKEKIVSVLSESGIESIELLKKKINADIPITLVINGKGIINKKVPFNENDSDEVLLQKALPNTKPEDFYLQKTVSSQNSVFVSVIRKNTVDELFKEFKSQECSVICCSLGNFALQSILPLLEGIENSEIALRDCRISISENKITGLLNSESENPEQSYRIGNDRIKLELLPAFASAVRYFAGEGSDAIATVPAIKENKEEVKQKKVFQTAGMFAVIFFFVILMGNVFVNRYFKDKKEELSSRTYISNDKFQKYDSLKSELSQKQRFFAETGLLQASKSSWYADQLAGSVPETIRLTELSVNPLERKSNTDEEKFSFVPDKIRIKGNCKKSTELNEWISDIKKKSWVKQVEILNYSQDKIQEAGIFTMELAMK